MKALCFDAFGAPEVLVCRDVSEPTPPARGDVLIEVHTGGVNFADTERRRGLYLAHLPLPDVIGFEGAGVVVTAGHSSDAHWVGRRVAFRAPQAHAEYAIAPVASLWPLPPELDFAAGAALPVQAMTAWHVVSTLGRLERGERVCIHSGAGGVGGLAVQLARARGAEVTATVSSDEKIAVARALGAHHVVVRNAGWVESNSLHARFDLVLDALGGPECFELAARVLAPFGRLVVYGTARGATTPFSLDALYEKSLSVAAFWLRTPLHTDQVNAARHGLEAALTSRTLRLQLDVRPLEHGALVHHALESGQSTGKFILQIR